METYWILKKTNNTRFPYHLTVEKGKEVLLNLLTQDRWPGTKGNIFCLQANDDIEDESSFASVSANSASVATSAKGAVAMGKKATADEEEIERVPVLKCASYGKKLSIILDRPTKKRCSFLFLTKKYKNKEGEYEQIFWQTQQGLTGHKSKYKLAYNKNKSLKIFVDSAERYAWNFPSEEIIKESLPIGDYAIKDDFGFLAVVERKTFRNFIAELGNLKKFHQHLIELKTCKNSALVIEAAYGDFLNNDKIRPYTGSFVAKAIAEINAMHPDLNIVFAGGRKLAIIWTFHFFQTVSSRNSDKETGVVQESAVKYGAARSATYAEDQARRLIISDMPQEFTTACLQNNLPQLSSLRVRKILEGMKKEGILSSEKKGRDIVWRKKNDYNENR